MLRPLLAALIATTAIAASSAGTAAEPPSSLEPGGPRAKLTVTHLHRLTASCYLHEEKGKKQCRAKREDAPSGASLVFNPVPSPRNTLTGKDPRAPVSLTLSNDKGTQQQVVELAEGRWDLTWQGHTKTERVQVLNGEDYTIALRTVTGDCKKAPKDQCRLEGAAVERLVTVPEKYRVAP